MVVLFKRNEDLSTEIMLSFMYRDVNTLFDIHNYLLRWFPVSIKEVKQYIEKMIKYNLIEYTDDTQHYYRLLSSGYTVLNDHKRYFINKIKHFLRKMTMRRGTYQEKMI